MALTKVPYPCNYQSLEGLYVITGKFYYPKKCLQPKKKKRLDWQTASYVILESLMQLRFFFIITGWINYYGFTDDSK